VPIALLGATGSAIALRSVARIARRRLPLPNWAVNAAVAYLGTRALGEAAIRYRPES